MHPALSVIVFTTATGAGYGMLFWLGMFAVANGLPPDRYFAPASLLLSLVFISAGLLSSTLHLGHPERAWRAISQWRSSWLSREGLAALLTYIPALLFGMGILVFHRTGGIWALFGALAALGATVTVICSAYIYRSLKPIQRWANGWVLPNYLALAAMTGALWLAALAAFSGVEPPTIVWLALTLIFPAALLKLAYWNYIDRTGSASTAETATGLAGPVNLLDPPHTAENYLLKEMGFRVARKHAARLRRIAFAAAFVLPFLLVLTGLFAGHSARLALFAAAAPLATVGALIERWLFFSEAKHTVTLYYGAARA
ncbi:MAG TPA: DmsC/YnfH family molybdoenzyme membrane anchor subunit [Rhizomicrobium sp.]|jgi:DMSO reductase anchor subunit|nr:DmsC/YnfH family molybdoenzyme membrane anchor subunit [Rhizomicrobium sp.]